jgi:uncharacterized membrane protein HdeD (DUF308 family)
MTETPPARPRSITAAFWLWLVSGVLLVFIGLLAVTITITGGALLHRISGGILIVTGLALVYLAGRSRSGDSRFAHAAVALSLALVVFLSILLAIQMLGAFVSPVVLFLIVAAGLVMRSPTAIAWFAANRETGEQHSA